MLAHVPLGPPPFAPPAPLRSGPLCSSASQLLWQSLTSRDRASPATAPRLPDADRRRLPNGRSRDLPVPAQGARDDALGCVAFHHMHGVGTQDRTLSRLDGWPMRSPLNASPRPSRATAHDSGPMWIAIPSSQGTCILYSLPVSRRFAYRVRFTPGPDRCADIRLRHVVHRRHRTKKFRYFRPSSSWCTFVRTLQATCRSP